MSFLWLAQPTVAQTSKSGSNGYFSVLGGAKFFDGGQDFFDHDLGYVLGGAFGYTIGNWRGEADVAYGAAEFEDDEGDIFELSVISGSLGLYYDITQLSFFGDVEPYLGGGAGIANLLVEGTEGNQDEDDVTTLTVHGETGLNFNVTQNLSIVPQYRFEWFFSGDVAGFEDDIFAHNFRLTARLWF